MTDNDHFIEICISDRVDFPDSLKEFVLSMESHYYLMIEDIYQEGDEWDEDRRLHNLYKARLDELKDFRRNNNV